VKKGFSQILKKISIIPIALAQTGRKKTSLIIWLKPFLFYKHIPSAEADGNL